MKSIKTICQNTLTIKKSIFITTLIPCGSIEQSKKLINLYSHKDATHNCVAYIIGNHEKALDDGEPSSTAGLPMLNVLKKQELNNIIAIVTRYFGGIKLGAGGLTRAYSQSVSEALKQAVIIDVELTPLYEITIDYHYMKKFEYLMNSFHVSCLSIDYDERVHYRCYISDMAFLDRIKDLTSNQFDYQKIGEDYIERT